MAGNNLFNFKLLIDNLPELNQAIKDLNNSLSKDFNPLVKTLADSIKDLKKIDHNTVQAIQAQHNGLSVGRNKTVINEDIMNWAVQDSIRMKKLQGMIEKAQEEQLRIIEEENKYRLEVLKERKRENDHAKWSEDYRDRSLRFRQEQAMGLYNEERAFNGIFKGYWAHRLYQSSKSFSQGNGVLNNVTSNFIGSIFGQTAGDAIGKGLLGSLGKALRRRAEAVDDNGDPKYGIGRITRKITAGGTKSGKGVNAAGGIFSLVVDGLLSVYGGLKTFNEGLIESASNLEKLTAQLSIVTGSQGAAYKTFNTIKDYAFNSPYTTTETTQTAVLLRQSGVLETRLDNAIRMLGDLGMGNQDRLNRISNNYSQILAAGRANSKDLREFANAGIPIYKALLEYFKNDPNVDIGNTTEGVRKLAEEGKVTAGVITRVFESLTGPGGVFNGASKTYANTYSGQMTNLLDRLDVAKGNVANIDTNFFANAKKDWIKIRTWWYELFGNEQVSLDRKIGKLEDREDIKELGGLRILANKRLKGKEIVSDEDFEKMTKEEKKLHISLSEYYKTLEKINNDLKGKGKVNNNSAAVTYFEGFFESFAKQYAQQASDYFEGLYQDNTTFAHQLSSSSTTYKENSEYYKVEKAIKDRKKYTDLIDKYNEYDELYNKNINDITSIDSRGGIGVESFGQLYDFISSGFLGNAGKINVSYNKDIFTQKDANELKANFGMFDLGIGQGFNQYGNAFGLEKLYDDVVNAVEDVDVNKGKTVNKLLRSIEKFNRKINVLKNDKNVGEDYKKFLNQLEQVFSFSFLSGYNPNKAPLDYAESFKMRTLRSISGMDALHGNTVGANMDEILRKQEKSLGTSVFKNRLRNSTLVDLAMAGDINYTGKRNKFGGMAVDYELMESKNVETFSDMTQTVKNLDSNLKKYANDMAAYSASIRSQIDMYTQLEETLQLGEDKLADAFYNLDDAQKASITAFGKVKTKTGEEYSDLEFQNGILYANIKKGDKDNWVSVFDKKSGLSLVMDDLAKQIADSKTDLLLLESRIKENTIVLTKINNIREQGNNRRFGNILTNSNYFAQKGFVADKGSDFFKDFNSVFASLYSEYMGLNLPDLSDELHGKEVAKSYMGGKYSYGQLRNIQDLQTKAPYESDSWIMKQLEIILGDNFKLLIDEFKKSQKTYDDQVGWKNLLASSIGLSYDTVKNKGTVGSLEIFGKLQSRDILKSTMIGLAQSGATMGDISNLGVKITDGTYNWNRTRANLFGKALNGEFNLETLNGLKTGLENSRNAIIDLQATLLTATETTSENNKAITDVLSTMFSGNKLKGILNGTEIELEQYLDEKTGTYGFKNKKTGEVVDTLNENFQFEQETTAKTLQELSNITNATLNSVKLLESMKSSLEAVENDTRELAIKNTFSSMSEYTPYFRGGNPYGQTSRASAWREYYENAYNNTRGTFINSALEIAKMDINSETLKQNLQDFNKKNGTSFDEENVSTVIENAQKLKKAIDTGDKEEIINLLTLLGFDQYSTSSASSAYATQGVISDRISSYKNLVDRFSSLNGYKQGFKNRTRSRYLGVSDVEESVLDIAQGRNPTAKNLSDEELMSAREALFNSFYTEKLESVQDGLSKAFDTFLIDNLTNSFEEMGALVRASADDWSSLGKSFVNTVKSMTSNMGTLMTTAGLELLIGSGGTKWAPALALIAAGGASSFVSGLLDSSEKDKNDEKLKKLEVLKNDLKDLLAQAKADAIYYEKELSNKQAITTTNNMVKVNDAVITPSGKVISTHPDDYLIATKTPQTLGASAPVVNLNIVNNSGQKLDIKQTTSSRNGQLNIEAVIEGVVNKGLANGSFDSGMNARDQRLAGRRVYM